MNNLRELISAEARKFNPLAIISYPIVLLVHILNALRVVWADLGYRIAIGVLGPLAIFHAMV